MSKVITRIASVVAACALLSQSASAANTASQTYTVVVPQNISISSPSAVTVTHDQTNSPQAFPSQTWVVKGNYTTGVNVNFATSQPFTHAVDSTFKRDAKLSLSLGTTAGPGVWTIGVAQDTTDYVAADGVAQVSASSNGVGRANLKLNVSFITGEFDTFAAGDYVTTVVGTVAAN